MPCFRKWVSRRRRYDELAESIREHLDEKVADLMDGGMTRPQAEQAARRMFGNAALIEERGREVWQWPTVHSCWADIRYALRQLRKSPAFATTIVFTMALGIGANLTIFLLLDAVALHPLPFPSPDELVRINRFYPILHDATVPAYSGTKALFLSRSSHAFAATAIYDFMPGRVNLIDGRVALPIKNVRVTPGFFHVFAMAPQLGREFLPQESGAAILSDATWRQRFNADPRILGRSITLGDQDFTIVGVASAAFHIDTGVDVWTPLSLHEVPTDESNMYNFIGRMKPGVTRAQAEGDLQRALTAMKQAYPQLWDKPESVRVVDLQESFVGQMRPALEMLMGMVTLVLVLVCANVLSLLLTRSIARRGELSMRSALGASWWRIHRQLWIENLMYCTLGGTAGVALAWLAVPVLKRLSPLSLPDFARVGFSGTALLLTGALACGCALLFSLVTALETRVVRAGDSLRVSSARLTERRTLPQKSLVASEVAISLVLLTTAGLMLTSFWKLLHVASGFDAANVITFKTSFSESQAPNTAGLARKLDTLLEELDAQPGIASAAAVNALPAQLTPNMPFDIAGRPKDDPASRGSEDYLPVTSGYFRTMGIPAVRGRLLLPSDRHGTLPVAVINQAFATRYFRDQNPVGQRLQVGQLMGPNFNDAVREVVGVAGDTRNDGSGQDAPAILYLPQAQIPDDETAMQIKLMGVSWVVRTKTDSPDVIGTIEKIFLEDGGTTLYEVQPLAEVIGASIAQQRFLALLLGCFGVISLAVGATGLYGVMAYSVAGRTREIGIRLAVGADRGGILGMVLREGGLIVGLGLFAGVMTSLIVTRWLHGLFFAVSPQNPLILFGASAVLLLTGLLAVWQPASRAASIEPMQCLRSE